MLLVKKKLPDGTVTYRFCIDLKKINSVTNKGSYTLPIISETRDALSGSEYLTTGDIDRAFWQVGVAEEDKPKTAFVVNGKLYESNVMPFDSQNAPSTFQRLIDRVLHGLTCKQCLIYIDDVLIFSKSFEQHLIDIDEVLSRIIFAGLKFKPTKCTFATNEVNYLGFRINNKGIHATEKKIEAILNLSPPDTKNSTVSFVQCITIVVLYQNTVS